MEEDDNSSPVARTFTLRSLLLLIAVLACPMAVVHYYVYGPDWFRLIVAVAFYLASLMFVLCVPTVVVVTVQVCQARRRATAIAIVLAVVLIALLALATIRLFERGQIGPSRRAIVAPSWVTTSGHVEHLPHVH